MPVIPILNSQDRKEFDSVPVFDSHKRKLFFRVSSQIQDILGKLRTSTTKVAFLIVLGYFKATKQFFNFGFHSQDVQYICTKLNINIATVDLKTYSRQKFAHHKRIIIELTNWKSFDEIVY